MINLICLCYNILTDKSENVGCNHSETTGKEKEETVCSLPEEFIGKENKKGKNIILKNYSYVY